ncbi:ABC transporter permease subunit [Streptomyces sp. JH14]|uniref:ABC transporter permease subunit n=1 Tax=Streptomyces sp. JH14 TaxID=2793630 RepID=UPI0023FA4389|nr:ABC transporter permease subunit [Streptomyces sp. JH14]MDF6044459.1 ABC transporter permease subunit [Streptomyces sp. JH14]
MSGTATAAPAPYRSGTRVGRTGFAQQLRAEWTKFRTVRGWVAGLAAAALVTVLIGLIGAPAGRPTCEDPNQPCTGARGPGGEAVTDRFYFVHRPLTGDGSITVRMTSLVPDGAKGGLPPWAKAGIVLKAGDRAGSAYAAVMTTAGHGVRMQYDYTQDTAGAPGAVSAASPHWLRLTRAGDTVTGYRSADGARWTAIATVRLAGLPSQVQAGLFAASPPATESTAQKFGGRSNSGAPTRATGVFDHVALGGAESGDAAWRGEQMGGPADDFASDGTFRRTGGTFTVTGSGDIAPEVGGPMTAGGRTIERSLAGTFVGLMLVIAVGATFVTAEYRRGLIRTTLLASPRRGRVPAAKAVVLGAVTFAAGLPAAAAAVLLGERLGRPGGFDFPVGTLAELRVVAGTAALLAVAAVLAMAVGTVLRRSAGAVTVVFAAIVLPYILATASILPAGPSQWLLRLTPAAGFAVQQNMPQYAQVDGDYTPAFGYFPLPPWGGFAVLCGWTAVALGAAVFVMGRRDA